jgi:hypothetical protein
VTRGRGDTGTRRHGDAATGGRGDRGTRAIDGVCAEMFFLSVYCGDTRLARASESFVAVEVNISFSQFVAARG